MKRTRLVWTMASGACAGLALVLASAANADVKTGVDAWSAGNFAKAVAEWRGPAAKGDADALFNLAQAYRLGRGVGEDVKQAETLYARAAARGHIKAADNYGLMLFQNGRREQAMPFVTAAAERGDPRAQYLIGLAHFNGDLLPKDWARAYALMTLANGSGLPQAASAISQMDEYVPLEQRQQAQALAIRLRANADSTRVTKLAAADLGVGTSAAVNSVSALPQPRMANAIASVAVPPLIVAAQVAVAEPATVTGTDSPADAGADFARGASPRPAPFLSATVVKPTLAVAKPVPSQPKSLGSKASAPIVDQSGPWKLQLGAYSVAGNVDRAWSQVSGTNALVGKSRQTVSAGSLTKLLASGWPSQSSAQAACSTLKASGHACVVTR